jgi:hypothetical protein
MQWIDVNAEAHERDQSRGIMRADGPHLNVCFRSPCHRYRVAVNDIRVNTADQTWTVWDMTGAAPMAMVRGLKSTASAMRFGDAVAESRALRVALRLGAVGRAVWAGVRRLTA